LYFPKVLPGDFSPKQKLVARQAFAGLLWNKQLYFYNVDQWCDKLRYDLINWYGKIMPSYGNNADEDEKNLRILMESPSFNLMCQDKGSVKIHNFQILKQQWLDKKRKGKIFSMNMVLSFERVLT
jgi:hypothetical protein